jgi:hypothetical protein
MENFILDIIKFQFIINAKIIRYLIIIFSIFGRFFQFTPESLEKVILIICLAY